MTSVPVERGAIVSTEETVQGPYCDEWLSSVTAGSRTNGFITFKSKCGYPFNEDGVCINKEKHGQ